MVKKANGTPRQWRASEVKKQSLTSIAIVHAYERKESAVYRMSLIYNSSNIRPCTPYNGARCLCGGSRAQPVVLGRPGSPGFSYLVSRIILSFDSSLSIRFLTFHPV